MLDIHLFDKIQVCKLNDNKLFLRIFCIDFVERKVVFLAFLKNFKIFGYFKKCFVHTFFVNVDYFKLGFFFPKH